MKDRFSRFARAVERAVASPWAFVSAVAAVVLWAASGPLFGYSEQWQLIINTGTTICTFLIVFLIQHTQSRDTLAVHLKLDELIRVNEQARNRVIGAQNMDGEELSEALRQIERISERERP